MAKVTSKLQVTIPKAIAEQYDIEPGDEIAFVPDGHTIRVVAAQSAPPADPAQRLALFDAATARQRARQRNKKVKKAATRGWTREDLYTRGRAR